MRTRAKRAKAARRPNTSSSAMKPGAVIENLAQTRRLAETALGGAGGAVPLPMPMPLSAGSGGGSGPGSLAHSSAFDEDKPTNTGSGSQEEDEEEEDEEEDEEEEERDGGLEHSMPFDEDDDDCDGCHVIPNDKSTEFILATVTAERRRRRQRQQSLAAAGVVAASAAVGTNGKRLSPSASITGAPIVTASAAAPVVACGIVVATTGVGGDEGVAVGGNHDSGYAASNAVEEEASPVPAATAAAAAKEADAEEGVERGREEGAEDKGVGGGRRIKKKRTLISLQRDSGDQKDKSKARKNGAAVTETKAASSRDAESGKIAKKGVLKGAILPSQGMGAAAASAAGVGLSAAVASKKERKSGSRFTIYKVHKASRKKREKSSAKKERKATKTLAIVLGVTAFILTTWLGYMNSFVNPVIYTIFNPEFRKAFKKLMSMGT
ncbi:hypothetical protein J437_LFUL013964 [Ladona fulva]|uniref:Uncharacterized protein n=1 Tax=Ladona fulva TaxID=123851 RepID=A0A8K0K9J4_LADFU|nr:hypothetical protein J437_LFUL013964 [Ladona fulva]